MLISIMDNDKLTKFNLPEKVEETFLIKYRPVNSNIDKDINVESSNGKWYLKSNGSIDVAIDNKIIDKAVLEEYNQYFLSVSGQKIYSILYCSPSNEEKQKYKFNTDHITIGKDTNSTICYQNNLMAPTHATIYCQNNTWFIKSSDLDWARVYVNNVREYNAKLHVGDVIFINGLKIIWMNSFIVINNPKGEAIISNILTPYAEENVDNTKYSEISEDEENVPLYDEKEYFSHVPRLRTVFETDTVEIDEPPMSQNVEDQPFIATIGTSLMMLASTLVMGSSILNSISNGTANIIMIIPQAAMIIAMIIATIVLPKYLRKYQRSKRDEKEALRQKKYTNYLNDKEAKIKSLLKAKQQVLNENFPMLNEVIVTVNNRTRRLWEKEIKDDDFLTIRLGLGNMPSNITINAAKERFTLDDDNLRARVHAIVDHSKILENVPVTFSFAEKNISAIISEGHYNKKYIDGLILQILAYHSPADLKIVLLTNYANTNRWSYLKFAPHCWTDDREMRFYADDMEEMKNISSYLENELNKRKTLLENNDNKDIKRQDGFKNFSPYYLIITDDYRNTKNVQFLSTFLHEEENYGFSLLLVDDSMRNMPNECDTFIDVLDKNSCIFQKELSSQTQTNFINEYVDSVNMDDIVFKLANIPVASREMMSLLPKSISFLEMYNVGNIKQLNILNRWKTSNPVITLEVPVGVHPSGELFKLNLHEKFHGPHGLIAGSTGSGKSEFIITYILSMAINYHPDDVQFVLIDYKGGGLAGAFENRESGVQIPHLAGTITNLDTNEMNRTLVSIQSELKRRQAKFNEARDRLDESTIDIYKYQRYYHEGLLDEPIAHLFIICDEFAELKSQQPEFMQQLISTSRIGRSLGVHLILATQKPTGVVNDQIWSNSRFKVCLKVQSRSDSMEMLKRPEAASIKDTGRFYLQVGYDELFELGQSAWCGAKYIPTERIKKKQDDSITFVDNTGYVIKNVNDIHRKEDSVSKGEQLTNIVKYLSELAEKENYHPHRLWLNKIPDVIYVDELKKKYNYKPKRFVMDSIIGEYDDPSNQKQDVVKLNLSSDGNALIYGLPTTGKENLLATIIYSMVTDHSVDELNMYIMDFGAETLRMFQNIPHIGDLAYIEDEEKIIKLLELIDNEIELRKNLFVDYAGSYIDYCTNSGNTLPTIVIMINGYENFQENFGKYEDSLYTLIRESNKYGIYFIVATSVNSCIRSRLLQNFNNRLSMQLSDPMDYRILLNAPKDLNPAHNYGRGIVRINDTGFEFQSAFITDKNRIGDAIKILSARLSNYYKRRAPKIPILPKKVIDSSLPIPKSLDQVPIGVLKKNVEPAYYDFERSKYTTIGTNILDDKLPFFNALLRKLSAIPNLRIKVIDAYQAYQPQIPNVTVYSKDFDQVINMMYQELDIEEKQNYKTLYFVVGIGQLKVRLSKEAQTKYMTILGSLKNFINSYFIAIDSIQALRSLELDSWYRNNVSRSDGIWLGDGFGSQSIIKVSNFTLEDRKVSYPEIAYIANKGKYEFVKYMIEEETDQDEE